MVNLTKRKRINVGTRENPIWAPEQALRPDSDEGREWWAMVATGSIMLPDKLLEVLLEFGEPNEQRKSER